MANLGLKMVREWIGHWSPALICTAMLVSSRGMAQDPDLKPGFPVTAYHSAGTYVGGPGIHTLVGNIDNDPELEIIVTALARGPLYAWKWEGSVVEGWPLTDSYGTAYPALGNLTLAWPGCQVFSGYIANTLAAYSGSGQYLPGWPRTSAGYIAAPAALADVDGDGIDEVFIGENDFSLHAYRANGTPLPGWPRRDLIGGQHRFTPAIADLDGDNAPEIVTVSGLGGSNDFLLAYHVDGTPVAGFPVPVSGEGVHRWPAIGDVDGDGSPEIIVVTEVVHVFAADGTLKRRIPMEGPLGYGSAPALADLDGDDIPEIIVQSDGALNVWFGGGEVFPGWPQRFEGRIFRQGNAAPVVGDVDGDGQPDIVVVLNYLGSSTLSEVRVYGRDGSLLPRFPKEINVGFGGVPAIADLDLDGRNDIIILGSYWDGRDGFFEKLWVYDLGGPPHGPIQWGQFGGGPRHQNRYIRPSERIGIEQCKINSVVTGWR